MIRKENNLNKSAVSLRYETKSNKAPVVTAKGRGAIAEKIIALAKENNIPIKEDPDLVHLLSQVNLNKEIPAELYQVVAELLSFVYKLNDKYSSKLK
jgi:flagellar biosynthesis protein